MGVPVYLDKVFLVSIKVLTSTGLNFIPSAIGGDARRSRALQTDRRCVDVTFRKFLTSLSKGFHIVLLY